MILRRSDVVVKLEACLAGQATPASLAAWAFDTFYALEQAELTVDEADQEPIAAVLDALMFADEPSFALDETDLRRLIAQLKEL